MTTHNHTTPSAPNTQPQNPTHDPADVRSSGRVRGAVGVASPVPATEWGVQHPGNEPMAFEDEAAARQEASYWTRAVVVRRVISPWVDAASAVPVTPQPEGRADWPRAYVPVAEVDRLRTSLDEMRERINDVAKTLCVTCGHPVHDHVFRVLADAYTDCRIDGCHCWAAVRSLPEGPGRNPTMSERTAAFGDHIALHRGRPEADCAWCPEPLDAAPAVPAGIQPEGDERAIVADLADGRRIVGVLGPFIPAGVRVVTGEVGLLREAAERKDQEAGMYARVAQRARGNGHDTVADRFTEDAAECAGWADLLRRLADDGLGDASELLIPGWNEALAVARVVTGRVNARDYDGPVYVGLEQDEPELVDEEYDEGEGR